MSRASGKKRGDVGKILPSGRRGPDRAGKGSRAFFAHTFVSFWRKTVSLAKKTAKKRKKRAENYKIEVDIVNFV